MSEKQPSNVIHMSRYREEAHDGRETTLEDFRSKCLLLSRNITRQDCYLKITSEYLVIPLADDEKGEHG